MTASGLYAGHVSHLRVRPRRHALKYRVFQLLLDLDELEALSASRRLFAHNRAALLSFHDRDHFDGVDAPLRTQVEARLARAGIEIGGGPIRVLCLPRVLGFVFNPISVWFCHRPDGTLAAIIHEVNSTFGERHAYVLPATPHDPEGGPLRVQQRAAKRMHVSPFMDMDLTYDFTIQPPGDRVSIAIQVKDADGLWLNAGFAGDRREFSDGDLFRAWIAHPLLTVGVVAAIHWEALKLWRKGVKFRPKPETSASSIRPAPRRIANI